jgi:hypothetical protein
MGYDASATWAVDLSGDILQIASIVISRDMAEYQSLYILFNRYKNGDIVLKPFMKVFRCDPINNKFEENKRSKLNNLELYRDSQPFFLDINGDMM